MQRTRTGRDAFTLIELMIVVAILGLLAALTVPNYLRFQLRARSSEGKTNLAAIRSIENAYFAEYEAFASAAATPATLPGGSTQPWTAPSPGCPNCFDQLGFVPESEVSFQYEVFAASGGTGSSHDVFTAAAVADLDADGTLQIWGYVRTGRDGTGVQPAAPCAATGIWNRGAASRFVLDTLGPCDATSGQSVF